MIRRQSIQAVREFHREWLAQNGEILEENIARWLAVIVHDD
jgi:hypothetical protein